jgi:hypothetical protein
MVFKLGIGASTPKHKIEHIKATMSRITPKIFVYVVYSTSLTVLVQIKIKHE